MLKKAIAASGGLGVIGAGCVYILKVNFLKNMIDKDVVYKYSPIENRREMINKLKKNQYDVLIIGGGATGAGLALDCATRGIKCALIEKDDFSSGTSSKSTKLLHGGIRYLENAVKKLDLTELYFVWEALGERAHAMKIAPFMSRSVPIIMPIYKYWEVPYFAYNIKVYDLLADLVCYFDKGVPNSSYIRHSNTLDSFPLLKKEELKGSLIYFDGQHNDSRMNLNLILTSAMDDYIPGQVGSTVCNHMEVIGFLKDEENKKIIGVRALDKINNKEIEIFAKILINATGPHGDMVRKLADENANPMIQLSSGCHFILPKWYSSKNNGMIIPKTSDGRVLFLLPWENATIVGTTDEERKFEENPKIQTKDTEFLANELSKYINVNPDEIKNDIQAAWCGYRPLVMENNNNNNKNKNKKNHVINEKNDQSTDKSLKKGHITTHKISRSHEIIEDDNGLISILGGKWTIYRKMAQDTLDYIANKHCDKVKMKYNCRTKFLKIIGSCDNQGNHNLDDLTYGSSKLSKNLVKKYNKIDYETAHHLVSNYGYLSEKVCDLANELNLFNKIDPTKPYIEAEVVYASRYEFASTVSDIIGRRFRLGFIDSDVANKVISKIANIMKDELSWSRDQMNQNVQDAKVYISSLSLE
ncbi:FAD-dependent glycerol-3-phosphate dehydrogenase [Plasmodium gonderi]|uniref:Glycerol-3-phosphate dehydrogenase n=1 Tax=Plasmodium gonderi TaxID=77519 RepID=A0A1Y1JL45_PLAGO|nr:FAD-dependent glycerol-3-phosphate dehydrogenase [Plasmodium gonderi]GAW80754.1 FAD-dependent glycerol-3-phosphate dehydrogenase [Plasmodium gonderi]